MANTALNVAYRLLALTFIGFAAEAEDSPAEVLRQAIAKVAASANSIVNCTCQQTVTRDFFQPMVPTPPLACSVLLEQKKHPTLDMLLRLKATDRLRFDVSMLYSGEIFSWPGASRFDDAGLRHLVPQGGIGTGTFAGFLGVVFKYDVRSFVFERYVLDDGRGLMEYSFHADAAEGHYTLQLPDGPPVQVGYSGTFQVDPETSETVRLTVETVEPPPSTHTCASSTTMDLQMAQIGHVQVLLPTFSQQRFVYPSGEETVNTTAFAHCHEFSGESTIVFAREPDPAVGRNGRPARQQLVKLPPNLRFKLELTAAIQTDTVAAGDPFVAKLATPILDEKQRLVASAGSPVKGRLLCVENIRFPRPEVLVILEPEVLEINGHEAPLIAMPDWTHPVVNLAEAGKKGVQIMLPLPGEEHTGVFVFSGEHVVINKGFRTDWRTASDSSGAVR
jgi:hypothetical protein